MEKLKEKYSQQAITLEEKILIDIKSKQNKTIILSKLKKKKIIQHYITICQKRIDIITEKEYALEQLNITSLLDCLQMRCCSNIELDDAI